jgi:hypothetical protein
MTAVVGICFLGIGEMMKTGDGRRKFMLCPWRFLKPRRTYGKKCQLKPGRDIGGTHK